MQIYGCSDERLPGIWLVEVCQYVSSVVLRCELGAREIGVSPGIGSHATAFRKSVWLCSLSQLVRITIIMYFHWYFG